MRWRDVILLSNRLRDGTIVDLPFVCHIIIQCGLVGERILQRDKVRPAEDCFEIKEFVLKLVSLIVRLYFQLGGEKTFRPFRDRLRDSENEIGPKLFAGF